jgi:hypothetical protein
MEVITKLTTHFQWKPRRREMATVGAQAREEELVATAATKNGSFATEIEVATETTTTF